MGTSLASTGDLVEGRAHFDQAIALYDPAVHRQQAARFGGNDTRVAVLSYRARVLWMLGYPGAALADAGQALKDAREIDQAATLMLTLAFVSLLHILRRDCAEANPLLEELITLADEKGAQFWKAYGTLLNGILMTLSGQATDAVSTMVSAIASYRTTQAIVTVPLWLSSLSLAYAQLGQYDDARRCVGEAMTTIQTTKERWWEAEVNRVAGEIALKSLEHDTAKAENTTKPETYFQRALAVARQQQAKSWELRAAMSMARLWRDQGKRQEARELLAPLYNWFTEGFDTLDLKEAKALLDELAA